ncbi:MAG TPA: outer membrane lipoprotein carrier protein LolA [Polyangiaceae bacterium]
MKRIGLTRREALASLLALSAVATVRPARADALDEALARIAKARAPLKTLVGPFTQERTIGLLSTSVKSHGTLTLVRPDRLRWELAPPDDVVYWITPEGLAYRSKSGQGRVSAAQARLASSLDDLRTLLGGDLGKLRTRYDLKLLSDKDGETTFEATPRDPSMPLKLLRFGVAADGATPRFAELFEGPRDKTRIEFGALQRDVPVDPALVRAP